ncbi:MAG: hypothetical protein TR69_WS6001001401 [candidate division WS6 bacterium OLB20]|uniref:Uncharacterized protein n=1 Tax=candidate division WS6 bacterium OLB20 TaxID=1617426 RepID=A0A136LVX6_9BACT|nr:MAG: hypothetical protein TR69_WS6001001401 [candidate division WS6 bacterium OLB20]
MNDKNLPGSQTGQNDNPQQPPYNRSFDPTRGHDIVDYQPGNTHMGNAGSQFGNGGSPADSQMQTYGQLRASDQRSQSETPQYPGAQQQPAENSHQFNQYNYYNQQQPVVERVVEVERAPKGKRFNPLSIILFPFKLVMLPFKAVGTFQRIVSTGCFLIVALIVLAVLFLIFRPVFLWNPLKAYLNEDIAVNQDYLALEQVYDEINFEAEQIGMTELDEEELTAIFKQQVPKETDVHVEVEKDLLRVMMNVEQTDHPLWFVIDIAQNPETGGVSIANVGFVRHGMPGGINSFVGDRIFSLLDLTQQQIAGNSPNRFMEFVVDSTRMSKVVKITDAHFEENMIVLEFEEVMPTGF